jgi:hypothetical protein
VFVTGILKRAFICSKARSVISLHCRNLEDARLPKWIRIHNRGFLVSGQRSAVRTGCFTWRAVSSVFPLMTYFLGLCRSQSEYQLFP